MAKNFFRLNPFRRKKRSLWKKTKPTSGGELPPEEEVEDSEAFEEVESELVSSDEVAGGEPLLEEDSILEEPVAASPEEEHIEIGDVDLPGSSGVPESPILEEGDVLSEEEGETIEVGGAPDTKGREGSEEILEETPPEDDLGKVFESESGTASYAEEPAAEAKVEAVETSEAAPSRAEAGEEEIRKVRDSVESLRKRAMTAGQLKETIERTIESRLAGLKEVTSRIQELFREGAGKLTDVGEALRGGGPTLEKIGEVAREVAALRQALGEDVLPRLTSLAGELEALKSRLSGFETVRDSLTGEIRGALEGVKRDLEEVKGKLPEGDPASAVAEALRLHEERLVAWLERINVRDEREFQKASEERSELGSLVRQLLESRTDEAELRIRVDRARGNLAAALGEVKETLLRNVIARSLVGTRVEEALEPAQSALNELESILRDL